MKNVHEMAEMVWRVDGYAPGPTLAIVGGVHGNERTGIEVVQNLRDRFEARKLGLEEGHLFLVLGNPRAIKKNTRGSEDGADLNRCFTPAVLAGEGASYEEQRARELAHLLQHTLAGIDLHATNKPSEPFLVSQHMRSLGEGIVRCLSAKLILTDPNWIFAGNPVTLDEYFNRDGNIGICYETGLAENTSGVKRIQEEMLQIIQKYWRLKGRRPRKSPTNQQTSFELVEAIKLTGAGFRFGKGLGTHNFQHVTKNQVIGYHGETPHLCQANGVIVFPKPTSLWRVGSPVGYLAKKK